MPVWLTKELFDPSTADGDLIEEPTRIEVQAAVLALEAVGRFMCKALLYEQPLGHGLGRFIFEYLADPTGNRIFKSVHFALAMLDDFDQSMASMKQISHEELKASIEGK